MQRPSQSRHDPGNPDASFFRDEAGTPPDAGRGYDDPVRSPDNAHPLHERYDDEPQRCISHCSNDDHDRTKSKSCKRASKDRINNGGNPGESTT